MNENAFDEYFKYNGKELEKFKNQNILKSGSPQEKFELNNRLNLVRKISSDIPENINKIRKYRTI
jgi:hypothetical protein